MYNRMVKIGLQVSDLERSLDFYEKTLGMRLMERFPQEDGSENVFLDGGGVILELMAGPDMEPGKLHHIAVEAEDTDEALRYFRSRQVPVTMEHVVVEQTIHLADIADPDGARIRLFHRENQEEG